MPGLTRHPVIFFTHVNTKIAALAIFVARLVKTFLHELLGGVQVMNIAVAIDDLSDISECDAQKSERNNYYANRIKTRLYTNGKGHPSHMG